MVSPRIYYFVLMLSSSVTTTAFFPSHGAEGPSAHTDLRADMDLNTMLHRTSVHQPEVFAQALTIIRSLETQPSCNRLATVALINSCQSLEVSANVAEEATERSELLLDEVKSEYAARLAICELTDAKAEVPRQCLDLVPSRQACGHGGLRKLFRRNQQSGPDIQNKACYRGITEQQFAQCQTALASRAQWWTSYSNARQNAVVVCQASRDAIEKDQQIAAYKAMAGVTSDLTSALSKSLQGATKFAEAVQAMQTQRLRENELGIATTKNAFSQLTADIKSAIESMLGITFRAAKDVESAIGGLRQSVDRISVKVNDTTTTMQALYDDAARRDLEYAAAQIHNWELSNDLSASVHVNIETIRNGIIYGLTQDILLAQGGVANLTAELQDASSMTAQNIERSERLAEELRQLHIGRSFGISVVNGTGIAAFVMLVSRVSMELAKWAAIGAGATWVIIASSALDRHPNLARCFAAPPVLPVTPVVLHAALGISVVTAVCILIYSVARRTTMTREQEAIVPKIEIPRPLAISGPGGCITIR